MITILGMSFETFATYTFDTVSVIEFSLRFSGADSVPICVRGIAAPSTVRGVSAPATERGERI